MCSNRAYGTCCDSAPVRFHSMTISLKCNDFLFEIHAFENDKFKTLYSSSVDFTGFFNMNFLRYTVANFQPQQWKLNFTYPTFFRIFTEIYITMLWKQFTYCYIQMVGWRGTLQSVTMTAQLRIYFIQLVWKVVNTYASLRQKEICRKIYKVYELRRKKLWNIFEIGTGKDQWERKKIRFFNLHKWLFMSLSLRCTPLIAWLDLAWLISFAISTIRNSGCNVTNDLVGYDGDIKYWHLPSRMLLGHDNTSPVIETMI